MTIIGIVAVVEVVGEDDDHHRVDAVVDDHDVVIDDPGWPPSSQAQSGYGTPRVARGRTSRIAAARDTRLSRYDFLAGSAPLICGLEWRGRGTSRSIPSAARDTSGSSLPFRFAQRDLRPSGERSDRRPVSV